MIYFVKMNNLRVVKIGFTARVDIERRLRELKRTHDTNIDIIALAAGQKRHEGRLHSWFAPVRFSNSELFKPDELLIEYANMAGKKYPVDGISGFAGDDLIPHTWEEEGYSHLRCAACEELRGIQEFCHKLDSPCEGRMRLEAA
jgi:hypothetical protein